MDNKIIIHNNTDLSDERVIEYVYNVISRGKVSQTGNYKHYCSATRYGNIIVTCTTRNGKTFTFNVLKE